MKLTHFFRVQEMGTVKGVSHQVKRDFLGLKWRELENISKPFCSCGTKRRFRNPEIFNLWKDESQ